MHYVGGRSGVGGSDLNSGRWNGNPILQWSSGLWRFKALGFCGLGLKSLLV